MNLHRDQKGDGKRWLIQALFNRRNNNNTVMKWGLFCCSVLSCAFVIIRLHGFHSSELVPNAGVVSIFPNAVRREKSFVDDQVETFDDVEVHRKAQGIAQKWNLTNPEVVAVLYRQILNYGAYVNYSMTEDLFVFFHPLKTGGTSLSNVLQKIFGDLGTIPGSEASDWFNLEAAMASKQNGSQYPSSSLEADNTTSLQRWWSPRRVLFSHTPFFSQQRIASSYTAYANDVDDGPTRELRHFLADSSKHIQLLTLIREPVSWRASHVQEWLCQVDEWQKRQRRNPEVGFCPTVNLTDVVRWRYMVWKTRTGIQCRRRPNRVECQQLHNGTNPFAFCSSLDTLFESDEYARHLHHLSASMFSSNVQPLSQSSQFIWVEKKQLAAHRQKLELSAIKELGGHKIPNNVFEFEGASSTNDDGRSMQHPTAISPNKTNPTHRQQLDSKYLWFGITERMEESMCLFHHVTKLPYHKMEQQRYKRCRPTWYWDQRHRDSIYERESDYDVVIYRVANALLDARMEWMMRHGGRDDIRNGSSSITNADTVCFKYCNNSG